MITEAEHPLHAKAPVSQRELEQGQSRCFVCIGKTGLWRKCNVATPVEGLLGSGADEGRAKLRYYFGKAQGAIEPKITEWDFLSLRTFALAKGNLPN